MATYFKRDIESTDDGDLIIDSDGDFKVATPIRTVAQAINNFLLTNKGELLTDVAFGANLQAFYGSNNIVQTHQQMERQIVAGLQIQGIVDPNDLNVDVVPIETDEAAILVNLKGTFVDAENTGAFRFIDMSEGQSYGYLYPFLGGPLRRIDQ